MRTKFTHFSNNFEIACKKIESDANFQPDINNKDLMALVRDNEGNARHTPRRSALAIQRSDIKPADSCAIYQIKIAKKGPIDEDLDLPVWHIDDSAVILVNGKGDLSLHSKENAEKGCFDSPVTHLSPNDFLNCSTLHPAPLDTYAGPQY
ncbi:hypothetical protein BN59_01525 [Legionella massiliensis]|uniref:Uncharacterized protein n=1 Tax=Legionella massiliensis TaxID=1034943 RepID=A0A078KZN8_9GAMM|nr:hypothetical protein [Legionella massiliensis]CDZ77243.1 hypothetical protein BN59_01525 [Legionella massiliensis]CEE12981.1 hypothetical protein BN1094_01525 [Legionella massiliensis]